MSNDGAIHGVTNDGDDRVVVEMKTFAASDGYVHRYRHWKPVGIPRGYIVSLHGIQSHSGWYEGSSSQLAAVGYDVRFLDRRGSGMHQIDRGHAESAERLIEDVVEFVKSVANDRDRVAPNTPLILSAVSWGGKLAAATMKAHPRLVNGLALLYPAIRSTIEPTWWQRLAITTACRLGAGRRMIDVPLKNPALFTDDPEWQAFIRNDPLALQEVSLAFLQATIELTRRAESAASSIDMPTFIALAGRDDVVDIPALLNWAGRLPVKTTTIVEYPTARHTLEFDASRERFVAYLLRWIESVTHESG